MKFRVFQSKMLYKNTKINHVGSDYIQSDNFNILARLRIPCIVNIIHYCRPVGIGEIDNVSLTKSSYVSQHLDILHLADGTTKT